jgi:hypothetical protein
MSEEITSKEATNYRIAASILMLVLIGFGTLELMNVIHI